MKCQRNVSPCAACLASRSCARFSPTTSMPASASTAMSVDGEVLRRGDDRHLRRRPRPGRARAGRAPAQRTSPMTPCVPRGLPVRRSEKKRSGRQAVQRSRRSTSDGTGLARGQLGRRPEVELAAADDAGAEPLAKAPGHVLPHLVAARADRRADDRRQSARRASARPSRRSRPRALASLREAPRERARRRSSRAMRDQHAVGPERDHRHGGLVRPQPVTRNATGARLRAVDGRGMGLVPERELLLVRVDGRAERGGGSRPRARRRLLSGGRG